MGEGSALSFSLQQHETYWTIHAKTKLDYRDVAIKNTVQNGNFGGEIDKWLKAAKKAEC